MREIAALDSHTVTEAYDRDVAASLRTQRQRGVRSQVLEMLEMVVRRVRHCVQWAEATGRSRVGPWQWPTAAHCSRPACRPATPRHSCARTLTVHTPRAMAWDGVAEESRVKSNGSLQRNLPESRFRCAVMRPVMRPRGVQAM